MGTKLEELLEKARTGEFLVSNILWTLKNNKKAAEVIHKEASEKIDFLIKCQESSDFNVLGLSRELALKVLTGWDKEKLAEKIDFLIKCQESSDSNILMLSRELALKVDKEKISTFILSDTE